ncbi:MAG: hypothetical protein CMJ83_21010 [Planctomycetes bacterium]|nr:hypothetical protein [Planctomycetota bacterium]
MPRPGGRGHGAPRPGGGGRRGLAGGRGRKGHGGARFGGRTRSGARGIATDWTYWWGMNGEQYLLAARGSPAGVPGSNNRDHDLGGVDDHEVQPITSRRVKREVLPALRAALRDRSPPVRRAAALALGRAAEPTDLATVSALRASLSDPDPAVQEGACLGLGFLGAAEAAVDLAAIAADSPAGRRVLGLSRPVPVQTRGFAAIAVGFLAARAPESVSGPARILIDLALTPSRPDVEVAAVAALSLLRDGASVSVCRTVMKNADRDPRVRAFAALALGRQGVRSVRGELRVALSDPRFEVSRAAATALGLIGVTDDPIVARALLAAAEGHADRTTRNRAWLAYGRGGGAPAQLVLVKRLAMAGAVDRPWIALALGLSPSKSSPELRTFLLKRYRACRSSGEKAAYAVALGLMGNCDAREVFARDFATSRTPALRSALASSLGLLKGLAATEPLRRAVGHLRHPHVARWSALALGVFGDAGAREALEKHLSRRGASRRTLALAGRGLAWLGDTRSLPTLVRVLSDTKRSDEARAYAVATIGVIGDKDGEDSFLYRLRAEVDWTALPRPVFEVLRLF